MPHDYSCCRTDVKGVLGAALGNLDAAVTHVDNVLPYPFHLITQYNGILLVGVHTKVL